MLRVIPPYGAAIVVGHRDRRTHVVAAAGCGRDPRRRRSSLAAGPVPRLTQRPRAPLGVGPGRGARRARRVGGRSPRRCARPRRVRRDRRPAGPHRRVRRRAHAGRGSRGAHGRRRVRADDLAHRPRGVRRGARRRARGTRRSSRRRPARGRRPHTRSRRSSSPAGSRPRPRPSSMYATPPLACSRSSPLRRPSPSRDHRRRCRTRRTRCGCADVGARADSATAAWALAGIDLDLAPGPARRDRRRERRRQVDAWRPCSPGSCRTNAARSSCRGAELADAGRRRRASRGRTRDPRRAHLRHDAAREPAARPAHGDRSTSCATRSRAPGSSTGSTSCRGAWTPTSGSTAHACRAGNDSGCRSRVLLLADFPILVLDEPGSHLDAATADALNDDFLDATVAGRATAADHAPAPRPRCRGRDRGARHGPQSSSAAPTPALRRRRRPVPQLAARVVGGADGDRVGNEVSASVR